MGFKEAYNAVAQKQKLPSYDELDEEMEMNECDNVAHPLRDVREAMKIKIDSWSHLMEGLVSPDSGTTSSLYESRVFTEKEMKDVFVLYSKIMHLLRIFSEAEVVMTDKTDVTTILYAWKEWPELKKQVIALAEKLKNSWTKPIQKEEHTGYLV